MKNLSQYLSSFYALLCIVPICALFRTCAGGDNSQYDGEWRANMRQGVGTALYEDGRYVHKVELVICATSTSASLLVLMLSSQQMFFAKSLHISHDALFMFLIVCTYYLLIILIHSIYHGEFWGNMKQGNGRMQRPDGSVYSGLWDANIIVGNGKVTIQVGNRDKRDGLPKEVRLECDVLF